MNSAEQTMFLRARIAAIDVEKYEILEEYILTNDRDMLDTIMAKYHALCLELDLHIATLDSLNEAFLRARIAAIEAETFEIHVEYAFTDERDERDILMARYHSISIEYALHYATLYSLIYGDG